MSGIATHLSERHFLYPLGQFSERLAEFSIWLAGVRKWLKTAGKSGILSLGLLTTSFISFELIKYSLYLLY
jgi:hypothetical protein